MITWNISQLDRQTSDGFVTTAHFVIAKSQGHAIGVIVDNVR